ncbi:MAG TPA: hypothetical protein H9959_03505 [Candidatus Mediterraneibacter ornithocaccae]|nr:hypothetical protein [Candidatus Mediterraneibacter ornithocaccae]
MSDDLISRKALFEEIQSFRCSITGLRAGKGVLASAADEYRKSILQIIEDQQTAFDKEKVIDQLKEEGCIIDDEAGNRAVEIIERGGIK